LCVFGSLPVLTEAFQEQTAPLGQIVDGLPGCHILDPPDAEKENTRGSIDSLTDLCRQDDFCFRCDRGNRNDDLDNHNDHKE
jgi:hypothetical protein